MKDLFRTILFFIRALPAVLLVAVLTLPLLLLNASARLRISGAEFLRGRFILKVSSAWCRHILILTGSELQFKGEENIPQDSGFCLIANHQSHFDGILLLSCLPLTVGLISKRELGRFPLLRSWMKALNCQLINRKSFRDSIETLKKCAALMAEGTPLTLFPEGTFAGQNVPAPFHPAGIRLAVEKGVPILPVSIVNSRGLLERHRRIRHVHTAVIIHPPLYFSGVYSPAIPDLLNRIISKPIQDHLTLHPEDFL